ncbi:4-azaleucine resistance transporter AzlC [Catenulispora sp. MAP5-51]
MTDVALNRPESESRVRLEAIPVRLGEWRQDAREAVRDTVPIAMGYVPLGATYGLVLVNAGLAWYWATLSSLVIFAGAMQFLSVALLASGAPLAEVATTALLVNLRHIFYGLSFPLRRIEGPLRRLYGVFALTDETYSVVTARTGEELTGRRIHLIQVFSHGWWVLGSTLGAAASTALPGQVHGIEFALTALFVVLAMEQLYKGGNARSTGYGAVAAAVAWLAAPGQFLSVALGVLLAAAVGQWWLASRKPTEQEGGF